jgi:tape measure domain-containing protein
MAAVTTELKVLVKAVGKGELKELEASLNRLAVTAKTKVDVNFKKVSSELKNIQSTSTRSIKNLRDYRNAWRDIAAQLDISSKEFKEATAEAAKLDAQLAKAEKRKPAGGGRFASAAKGVGAIAGAGVFGGPEGALGAAIGLGVGGPGAAIVGGAIGAQVGQFRKALGAVAEYGAEISKLRIALRGVSSTQLDYEKSLRLIQQATEDFAIPQSILTKQFTRLQASVQGAGGSVQDTKTAFNGIVAAVRATGGSLQDVDSALTATAQVFSKGKVSAEELRQQIGERLPGAFTLFAESIGKTPQELDKALEDGKVTLQDFLTFSESLFEKFGETAQIIADGPEGAGDRLVVAMEKLNEQMSPELANLGAQFQGFATEAIQALSSVFTFLGELGQAIEERVNGKLIDNQRKALAAAQQTLVRTDLTPLQEGFARSQIAKLAPIVEAYDFIGPQPTAPSRIGSGLQDLTTTGKTRGGGGRGRGRVRAPMGQAEFEIRQRINEADRENLETRKLLAELDLKRFLILKKTVDDPLKRQIEIQSAEIKFEKDLEKLGEKRAKEAEKYKQAIIGAGEAMGKDLAKLIPETTELQKLWKSIGDTISSSIGSALEDVIFNAKSLQESLSGILRSLASMFLQLGTKSLIGMIPDFADGGIMSQTGPMDLKRYARGGIASSPQLAMFGEGSTPEAYVPLPDGRSIPVTMRNGGTGNIVVNVDAKGTQVEGDEGQSKQLGGAISAAVQAELIKQQRPGGLLSR